MDFGIQIFLMIAHCDKKCNSCTHVLIENIQKAKLLSKMASVFYPCNYGAPHFRAPSATGGGRKGPDFTAYHFANGNGDLTKGILGS